MNFSEGVPNFILVINESLEFKTFHIGIRVSISCVVKNVRFLNSWSAIEEIVTCLNLYETSHKVEVIHHELKSMSTSARSKKLYCPEEIVRAFSYFATSRSLYKQIRRASKGGGHLGHVPPLEPNAQRKSLRRFKGFLDNTD